MTFEQALIETLSNSEFVANYDRLIGGSMGACLRGAGSGGLAHQIDVATGRFREELLKFTIVFTDLVWNRIPNKNV